MEGASYIIPRQETPAISRMIIRHSFYSNEAWIIAEGVCVCMCVCVCVCFNFPFTMHPTVISNRE